MLKLYNIVCSSYYKGDLECNKIRKLMKDENKIFNYIFNLLRKKIEEKKLENVNKNMTFDELQNITS